MMNTKVISGQGKTVISFWDPSGKGKSLFITHLLGEINNFPHNELVIQVDEIIAPVDSLTEKKELDFYQSDEIIHWNISRELKTISKKGKSIIEKINHQEHRIEFVEPFRSHSFSQGLDFLEAFAASDAEIIIVDPEQIDANSDTTNFEVNERLSNPPHDETTYLIDLSKYVRQSRFFRTNDDNNEQSGNSEYVEKEDRLSFLRKLKRVIQYSQNEEQIIILCVVNKSGKNMLNTYNPIQIFRDTFGEEFFSLLSEVKSRNIIFGHIDEYQLRIFKQTDNMESGGYFSPVNFFLSILQRKEEDRLINFEINPVLQFLLDTNQYKNFYVPYFEKSKNQYPVNEE